MGVGVAPAQVGLQAAGQRGMVGWLRHPSRTCATARTGPRPGLARKPYVGVGHSSTLCRAAEVRTAAVSFAEVVQDHADRGAFRRVARIDPTAARM